MNQRERKFWARLRPRLAEAGIYTERIENAVGAGKPDVDTLWRGSYVPCELKAIAKFPARPSTPVLGRHGLRPSQRNWFLNWYRAGGTALILVSVGSECFAFGGADHDCLNDFNTPQFRAAALAAGYDGIIQLIKDWKHPR